MSFIAELRRRHVIRTVSYYLGAAWMLIGVGDIFFPMWGLNEALLEQVIWVLLAGIPVIAVLAWFFDTGLARPAEVSQQRGRPVDLVVIVVLALLLAGMVGLQLRDQTVFRIDAPLVAVLPFDDLSEVGEHVSSGLADELLNLLVREPDLRLMGFDTASNLGVKGAALLDTLRELQADYMVRGAVRVQGDMLRVNVRLVDVRSGQVIWSDQVDGSLSDVFLAQQTIAQRMKESLSISIQYAYVSGLGMIDPTAVDGYLRAAQLLREEGGLAFIQQARDELERVVRRAPALGVAHGRLCSAHLYVFTRTEDPQDFRSAERVCTRAREVDPGAVDTRLAQASLYQAAGQFQRAAEIARELVQSHPDFDRAHATLAEAQWSLGDLDAAQTSFRAAITAQPTHWANYLSLGNFYARQQRYTEAIAPFTRITELNPDDFIGWASLGVTHYEAGDFELAEEYLLKSLTLHESSRSYFNLGLIYQAQARPGDAAAAFGDAVRLNPRNYRALMFRASSQLEAGDEEGAAQSTRDALEVVTGLLEINPNDAYVRANGALLLADLGRLDDAVQWAEEARQANTSDNPKVQLDIALVYYQAGDAPRAVQEMVAAVDMGYPQKLFFASEVPEALKQDPRIAEAYRLGEAEP